MLLQVRTLVDVPGEKLPSAASGALQEYLRSQVGPQVCYFGMSLYAFLGCFLRYQCNFLNLL